MDSLQTTDAVAAAGATHPRVSLDDIKNSIADFYFVTAGDAVRATRAGAAQDALPTLDLLTVCFVVMKNGFVVIGKSAPASAANFDAEKGRTFAWEDAIRQLWPLMGFSLRDQLSQAA